ncbi:hypothetical protein NQ318_010540 [Aromia moschata]|uniref:Uncharacterized protein n=1 Tax=Aromia moschata TaxID=1265417 RepID=A0AAV8YHF6_9CUCU|nr:hypothetical protein NQ318_010540 [Aromia moschata]
MSFKKQIPLRNDSRKSLNIKEEADTEECQDKPVSFMAESNCLVEMQVPNDADYDDIFDTIAKNVAQKIRDMTEDQRKYAEKLVNEVMYYGLMECLTSSSRLSIDGT